MGIELEPAWPGQTITLPTLRRSSFFVEYLYGCFYNTVNFRPMSTKTEFY